MSISRRSLSALTITVAILAFAFLPSAAAARTSSFRMMELGSLIGDGVGIDDLGSIVYGNPPKYFRSVQSGSWSSSSTWQESLDGTNWGPALLPPSSFDISVNIRAGHTVTTGGDSSPSLTIDSGGTLAANEVNFGRNGAVLTNNGTITTGRVLMGPFNGNQTLAGTGSYSNAGRIETYNGVTVNVLAGTTMTATDATNNSLLQVDGGTTLNLQGVMDVTAPNSGSNYELVYVVGSTTGPGSFRTHGNINLFNGPFNLPVEIADGNAISGATINGALTIDPGASLKNGGSLTAGGNLTVAAGATLDMAGGQLTYNGNNTTLTNNGTISNTGGHARILMTPSAGTATQAFAGSGHYGDVTLETNASTTVNVAAGTSMTFDTATNGVGLQLDTNSTVNIPGTFNVTAPANPANYVQIFVGTAAVQGAGLMKVSGSIFWNSGSSSFKIPVEMVSGPQGGGFTFGGNVTIDNTASYKTQSALTFNGNLTIAQGGTLDLNGANTTFLGNGKTFINNGSIINSGPGNNVFYFNGDNGVTPNFTERVGSSTGTAAGTITFEVTGQCKVVLDGDAQLSALQVDGTNSFDLTGRTLKLSAPRSNQSLSPLFVVGAFLTPGSTIEYNGTADQILYQVGGTAFAYNNLTINNTVSATLPEARTIPGTLTLQKGTFITNNNLTMGDGATIVRSVGTLSAAPVFGTTVNVTYTNAAPISTSFEQPIDLTILSNLTLQNTAPVTLSAQQVVNGTLNLAGSNLQTGANTLYLNFNASRTRTSGYIIGNEAKNMFAGSSFVFDVGTASGYAPVTVGSISAAGQVKVSSIQGPASATGLPANRLQRSWQITGPGTADLTFGYPPADIVGNEAAYRAFRIVGSTATQLVSTTNTATHTTSVTGADTSTAVWTTAEVADTDITVAGGTLTITDVNGGNSVDNITLSRSGANVRIKDPGNQLGGGTGCTPVDANTVDCNLGNITSIQVNTLAGNDTLTVDLASGNPIPSNGISYDGGTQTASPGDKLAITGGAQGTVTYNFTNAHDGSVLMSNFGTINYVGLEPVNNSGASTDVTFNLPAVANNAGMFTAGGGQTTLSGATFESVTFTNPSNSVSVFRGTAADQFSTGNLGAGFPSLTIGSNASPFNSVSFNDNASFAADKSLAAYASTSIGTAVSASLGTSGTGSIFLSAGTSISVANSSSLMTVNGPIDLFANNGASANPGNFNGITIDGFVQATGTGTVGLTGRGGTNAAGSQVGVRISGFVSGGTSGAATNIIGTGGVTPGNNDSGVVVAPGGSVTAAGGNVHVTGYGGAGGGNANYGVTAAGTGTSAGAGRITSVGPGNVLIEGTGGAGSQNNIGVLLDQGGSFSTGTGGNLTVYGTGGTGTSTDGVQLYRVSQVGAAPGGGTTLVHGEGGGTAGNIGNGVHLFTDGSQSALISAPGAVTVEGNGANAGGLGILLEATATGTSMIRSTSSTVTLAANSMTLDGGDATGTTSIPAASGSVTVKQFPGSAGQEIQLGSADVGSVLGLTDSELDRVTTPILNIGDVNSGPITVTANITRAASTVMNITNGSTWPIKTTNGLINSAGGNVTFDPGTDGLQPKKAGNDVNAGAGTVKLKPAEKLAVTIGGTSVDTQYDQLNVIGGVDITGSTLQVNCTAFVPASGQQFVIISNDGADPVLGTFANAFPLAGFCGSPFYANINYAGGDGNDVVLTVGALTAGEVSITGRVATTDGRGITNARIAVSGGDLSEPITAVTGRRGQYVIQGLSAGKTYVITVAARRFFFTEPTRVITANDNLSNIDFTATGDSR